YHLRHVRVHPAHLYCPTRRSSDLERAHREIDNADHRDTEVGLLLMDLDRFKEVNDTFGHATGDRMLQAVARRLTHSVRPGDLVRSEEHTSELQSRFDLVCRLLLDK